ncbi:hypothetical protein WJ01_03495 [Burkholderia vietnamiensis]|nr:hypothetical protein WJ01_03495 [Burkholderia vietnamiensis]
MKIIFLLQNLIAMIRGSILRCLVFILTLTWIWIRRFRIIVTLRLLWRYMENLFLDKKFH